MASYATIAQFHRSLGLRAEAFVVAPRNLTVVQATSRFLLPGHGLADGELVRFVAQGASATLPAPLLATSLYPVTTHGADIFSVGETLTSAGTGVIGIVVDVQASIQESLDYWSGWVDHHLVNHTPPLAVAPRVIPMLVCHLAAYDLAIVQGLANPTYQASAKPLQERAAFARAELAALRKGGPLPGVVVDQTPDTADNAPQFELLTPSVEVPV